MNMCMRFGGSDFNIGVPVFRWFDIGEYNGYITEPTTIETRKGVRTRRGYRFGPGKREISDITQLVVHHSGGDGKNPYGMYQTLWFDRFLSVQCAIEDDGRVYQFLDPVEIAWHAGRANKRSFGVECCLRPDADANPNYYSIENQKRRGNLPHAVMHQTIQGMTKRTFAMPDKQIDSLARVCAAVWIEAGHADPPMFPRVPENGGPIPYEYVDGSLDHIGLVGHFHLTRKKWDPAGIDLARLEELVSEYFSLWLDNSPVTEY